MLVFQATPNREHILSACTIALDTGIYTWQHLIILSRINQAGMVRLVCQSKINQVERFSWFAWAGLIRLGWGAWFAWAGFFILLRKIRQIFQPQQSCWGKYAIRQTIKICEMSKVKIMLLNTSLNLLNFFRAPFLFKWCPNLLKWYNFKCRKSEQFLIRHRLLDQAPNRPKSGGSPPQKKNCIDATIRIGQESWCLPYARFFEWFLQHC